MAKKTVTVTLGGDAYEVPRLNIGQLEEVSDLLSQDVSDGRRSLAILRIALRRATPKVDDVGEIEMDLNDMSAAVLAVLELAGLKQDAGPTPAAPATLQAA